MNGGKTAKTWKCSDCGSRVRFGDTPRTRQYDPPQRPIGPTPARLCYRCAAAMHCQAQLDEIRRRLGVPEDWEPEEFDTSFLDELTRRSSTGDFFNKICIALEPRAGWSNRDLC